MTKFFAQLLVSVLVGLGAAAGFSPDVKNAVSESWADAKTFLNETADSIIGLDGDVNASIDADAALADAELTGESEVELDTDFDLNVFFEGIHGLLPDSSADGSSSAESEAEKETDSQEASLDLEGELESDFEIILGE